MAAVEVASPVAGEVLVNVEYDADFATSDVGVSRIEADSRPYLFTQFALIDARRAFPCFDEPGIKVPFTLALTVPSDQVVFANTPEESRTVAATGHVRVQFRETPPLPAYLVAFGVGLFDTQVAPEVPPSGARARSLPLRAFAAKGRASHLAPALPTASASVRALEDYLGQAFPFEKLDLIAVPEKTGAMENAGAITFPEYTLLLDPATATENEQRYATRTIAHEIAHQWLGDLVTMSFWDDLSRRGWERRWRRRSRPICTSSSWSS
jgi:alanyl aminopeptidase